MNTKKIILLAALFCGAALAPAAVESPAVAQGQPAKMDPVKYQDWLKRWETRINGESRNRFCDKEVGEELGWLLSPILDGYYQGYLATRDPKWVDQWVDWTDCWVKRGVKEPDGCVGWPKAGAASTKVDDLEQWTTDSLLGEAMALRPVVLMSREILRTPALKEKYGAKAESYLRLSQQVYEKWDKRGAWRETKDGGVIGVVLPFGIDQKSGGWTASYLTRNAPGNGFSLPDNKANLISRWLLAMFDATGNPIYKERAEKWFRIMKSRMQAKPDGTFAIWNYWQPAGPWDYKADGSTKHWVGIHPNPGYYEIDLGGIVDACEHGLVFTRRDLEALAATAIAEKRYWTALAPYDAQIQKHFEDTFQPDSWAGLAETPAYLARQSQAGKRP